MVYNTIEDYEKLADAILTLKAEESENCLHDGINVQQTQWTLKTPKLIF